MELTRSEQKLVNKCRDGYVCLKGLDLVFIGLAILVFGYGIWLNWSKDSQGDSIIFSGFFLLYVGVSGREHRQLTDLVVKLVANQKSLPEESHADHQS